MIESLLVRNVLQSHYISRYDKAMESKQQTGVGVYVKAS